MKPEFFRADTKESMMRKMSWEALRHSIILAYITIGGALGFLFSALFLGKDLNLIGTCVGAYLGGASFLIGGFLVSAFGGKAAQSFAENKPDQKQEEQK